MRKRKVEENKIVFAGDLVYIYLSGKNAHGRVAITDIDSYHKCNIGSYNWYVDSYGYAITWDSLEKKTLAMHRLVSGNNTKNHTDHIERNKKDYQLDNRRCNLRICTNQENQYNTTLRVDNKTGYRCVTDFKGQFRCMIKVNQVKQFFGCYDKPEMAALAHNEAMKVICPGFANFNEIPEGSLTAEEIDHVTEVVAKRLEKINSKYCVVVNPDFNRWTDKFKEYTAF